MTNVTESAKKTGHSAVLQMVRVVRQQERIVLLESKNMHLKMPVTRTARHRTLVGTVRSMLGKSVMMVSKIPTLQQMPVEQIVRMQDVAMV